eukprot:jgi/Botrbrau1/16243/Bobra.0066s0028.1
MLLAGALYLKLPIISLELHACTECQSRKAICKCIVGGCDFRSGRYLVTPFISIVLLNFHTHD